MVLKIAHGFTVRVGEAGSIWTKSLLPDDVRSIESTGPSESAMTLKTGRDETWVLDKIMHSKEEIEDAIDRARELDQK